MNETSKLDIRKSLSSYDDYVDELVVDAILKPVGKSKEAWAEKFLAKYLAEAMKDPKSRAAQHIASVLIKCDVMAIRDVARSKERKDDIAFNLFKIRQNLYDKQQEVFDDEIDQRHIIINSRRSGKTHLMGHLVAKALYFPDAHVVYLNRTSSAAIRQLREPLRLALEQSNLKIIKGSVDSQEVHFSNGSQLLILGNNNSADIDRTRGERISCCIMDECGHQRNVRQLLREVIGPALKDYGKDSKLYIVGTPPRIPRTYVEEVWNNAKTLGWKRWHWTFADNPFIPDRDKVIEEVCRENGCTPDSAFIQREYFGKMGVYDTDAVIFRGYKTYDGLKDLTTGSTQVKIKGEDKALFKPTAIYIGIDWGGSDYNAIVSVAVDAISKKAFVYDVWADKQIGLELIKSVILKKYNDAQALLNVYGVEQPKIRIVTDTNMVEFAIDLRKLGLPVTKAIKYDMMTSVETMATELRTGRLLTPSEWKADDNKLIQDFEDTVYKRDEETDALMREIDDDTYHPDAAHALRYAVRQYMEDGQWIHSHDTSIRNVNTTVPAGLEDLKEYGNTTLPPWLKKGDESTEVFTI